MKLSLEDLTKNELLQLIRRFSFGFEQRDMQTVRWNTMGVEAKSLMDESIAEIDKCEGIKNHAKWMKAQDKFDRALKLYDKADSFFREMG